MLDALYTTLFRLRSPAAIPTMAVAWAMWGLLALLSGLHLGAMFDLSGPGVLVASTGALACFALGWLWLGAFSHLLAGLLGGQGTGPASMGAIASGFWPLILAAPLEAGSRWLGSGADVLQLLLGLWVIVALVRAVAAAHHLGWGRATLCLAGAWVCGFVALGALVVAPVGVLVFALS